MKKVADLEAYEILLITLFGLALADLLSGSLKTLFFNTLSFDPRSFKDTFLSFAVPLLLLIIVVFVFKPPPKSLI